MSNLTEFTDIIDIEVTNRNVKKVLRSIRSFTKLNRNIREVSREPSIFSQDKTIIGVSVPSRDKASWIRTFYAQFENDGLTRNDVTIYE